MSCAPVDRMTPPLVMLLPSPLFSSLVPSIPFNPASVRQAGHLVINLNSPWFLLSYLRPSSTAEALPPKSVGPPGPAIHIRPCLYSRYLLLQPWGPSSTKPETPLPQTHPHSSRLKAATACLMPSLYKELLYLALATTPIGRYYYLNFKEREWWLREAA